MRGPGDSRYKISRSLGIHGIRLQDNSYTEMSLRKAEFTLAASVFKLLDHLFLCISFNKILE